MTIQIHAKFHPATWTLTYLVWDPDSRDAVVIDPVLDFEPAAVSVRRDAVDALSERIRDLDLNVHFVLETHAHADHLTAAQALRERFGAQIVVSDQMPVVQRVFAGIFNVDGFVPDGRDFDRLVADGEVLRAGSIEIEALSTPGHTPACTTWRIADALFTGDTLFMPDFGTGRCDFPGGSAETLYDSIQRLYALPAETRVFVGHDYQPGGRELAWETTIGASREDNRHLRADTSKADFVAFRTTRDRKLSVPRLILPSLQVNMRAGLLPEPDDAGRRYLRLPINLFN